MHAACACGSTVAIEFVVNVIELFPNRVIVRHSPISTMTVALFNSSSTCSRLRYSKETIGGFPLLAFAANVPAASLRRIVSRRRQDSPVSQAEDVGRRAFFDAAAGRRAAVPNVKACACRQN